MIEVLAGIAGVLGALAAHDLAVQSLRDLPLRPFAGTCRACGEPRGWLRPRCPRCGRPLGREVWFAVVGGLVAWGFANTIGPRWALVAYLGFLVLSMALGITDLDDFRIVDRLNLRGTAILAIALGAASLVDSTPSELGRGLLGALAYFVGGNVVFLLARGRGFGYGDVKLAAQLGLFTAFLSWGTLGWAVLITALLGGLASIVVLAVGGIKGARARRTGADEASLREVMRTELPYGPAMIIGAWGAIVLAGLGAFPLPS